MQLPEFITTNMDPILRESDTFARSVSPVAKGVSAARLRDHAREMLLEIAADMHIAQPPAEQQAKSEGHGMNRRPSQDSPARTHALARIADSFTLNEVVGETRALRASVVRLWTREMGHADRGKIDELIRFNESIDQALSESVARYLASPAPVRIDPLRVGDGAKAPK